MPSTAGDAALRQGESEAAPPVEAIIGSGEEDPSEESGIRLPLPLMPPKAEAIPISLEQAAKRIGHGVLQVLEEKFNGSLVAVRPPDERDHLF